MAGCIHWAVAGCVGGAFEEWQNGTDWLEVSLHSFTAQGRDKCKAKSAPLSLESCKGPQLSPRYISATVESLLYTLTWSEPRHKDMRRSSRPVFLAEKPIEC